MGLITLGNKNVYGFNGANIVRNIRQNTFVDDESLMESG